MTVAFDIVVPTVGRPSLRVLLDALAHQTVRPGRVIVVDDRTDRNRPLPGAASGARAGEANGLDVEVRHSGGRGPAAARNVGWRAAGAEWVAFLDDDVLPPPAWCSALIVDLTGLPPGVAGSQGRIRVPLPARRRPTDWERNVAGLERARWATADMAYRRGWLSVVGGFDERFPRAYREDADLGLRIVRAGGHIVAGGRRVIHPVGPADRWVSVRLQRGNADDVLMRAAHGRRWRTAAGVPQGRRPRHLAVTASGLVALAALALGRRRLAGWAGAGWLAGTTEFAAARLAPGPATREEALTMLATSVAIPPVATYHTLAGVARLRHRRRGGAPPVDGVPEAVFFDRDGTLVVDVPYNGDPDRVAPLPGARRALDRLRAAGIRLAVVSNQSGIARGRLTPGQVEAVNRRVEELLGPVGPWLVCPHGPDDGCTCRKPAPGLVLQAAAALGVDPRRCALVGDIGADVEAALAAGARAVLVPTGRTRLEEILAAPEVALDLDTAVDRLLGGSLR